MKRRVLPSFTGKRGICGVCHEARPLTTDGLLRRHSVIAYAPSCPGSFTEPTQIVNWKGKKE